MIDPVGRILGIARDKRRACLVDTEQTSEETAFSRKKKRYAVARLDTLFNKVISDNISFFVELAVSQNSVLRDQRGLFGVFSRAALK